MNVYKITWRWKDSEHNQQRVAYVVGYDLSSCEKQLSEKHDDLNYKVEIVTVENLGEALMAS